METAGSIGKGGGYDEVHKGTIKMLDFHSQGDGFEQGHDRV